MQKKNHNALLLGLWIPFTIVAIILLQVVKVIILNIDDEVNLFDSYHTDNTFVAIWTFLSHLLVFIIPLWVNMKRATTLSAVNAVMAVGIAALILQAVARLLMFFISHMFCGSGCSDTIPWDWELPLGLVLFATLAIILAVAVSRKKQKLSKRRS